MAHKEFSRGFLFGAFAGGLAAAVAVLLLTPTTGDRLRRQLIYRLSRLIEGMQEQLVRLRQTRLELPNEARGRDRALIGELRCEAQAIAEEMQGLMQQLRTEARGKRHLGQRDLNEGVAPTG
ncbi:MAG: hypothetical protein N2561_07455 [Bacteroidetes bacterium]|nr:hypothetical protein [Rhodothermia bacterium]MCS7155137.1 hypothetical protein [Bacteroidota bacterium]MCX7907354.1 hypothetical protein [Bacteroidota bacterium]MDW8137919.1 hypothetical protein [Bacteroidota bacterium]MDW8286230.1 hypothetical protein [Bacteroidota bacterium]